MQALLCFIEPLSCFKASAHDKGVGRSVSELLVLNDVAAAIKDGSGHRVNDAWLIGALQGSDEIHAMSLKETSE
jgi:hypothetical protein